MIFYELPSLLGWGLSLRQMPVWLKFLPVILLTVDSPSATWLELCLWSVLALSVFTRDIFNRKYCKCSLFQVHDTHNRFHAGLNWEGPLHWSDAYLRRVRKAEGVDVSSTSGKKLSEQAKCWSNFSASKRLECCRSKPMTIHLGWSFSRLRGLYFAFSGSDLTSGYEPNLTSWQTDKNLLGCVILTKPYFSTSQRAKQVIRQNPRPIAE